MSRNRLKENYQESEKRKADILFTISKVIIVLSVLAILIALLFTFGKKKVVQVATDAVAKEAIKKVVEESGLSITDEEVEEALESVDEKDKEVIYNIVEEHLDQETLDKSIEYVKRGDINSLEKFARDELSDEEIEQLKGLYEKYKDQIQ